MFMLDAIHPDDAYYKEEQDLIYREITFDLKEIKSFTFNEEVWFSGWVNIYGKGTRMFAGFRYKTVPDLIPIKEEVKKNNPIVETLRRLYPNGHPDFIGMCLDEIKLHSKKNFDYAQGGKPTGNFERVAAILALYPKLSTSKTSVVAIVYLLKQLDAALWLENSGHTAKVQGQDERWQDVSVYAKLISLLQREVEKNE